MCATRSTPASSGSSTPPAGSRSSSRSTPRPPPPRRPASSCVTGARTAPRRGSGRAPIRTGRHCDREGKTMNSERLDSLLAEYAELEQRLADPAIHADQAAARKVGRRFAELTPIAKTAAELAETRSDLTAARELAAEDADFAAEAVVLEARLPEIE